MLVDYFLQKRQIFVEETYMITYILGVFITACVKPTQHQQQTTSRSNNVFLKHSTTFESSFSSKRSFRNNFLQKKQL